MSLDLLTITADQGDIAEVRVLKQASDSFSGKSVEICSFESQSHIIHTAGMETKTDTFLSPDR